MTTLAESEKAFRRAVAAAPKHTHRTPWFTGDNGRGLRDEITDKHGELVCRVSWDAYRDFIVKACNSHDDLMAALHEIEQVADAPRNSEEDFANIASFARAAIAKAKS